MDDIRLPFPKENHTNSPVSMTSSTVMDHHHHHHHHQQQHHTSMTPSRSFRQQPSLHQNNSDLASSTNKIKSSGNCCGGPGGSAIVTTGSAGNGVAASSSSACCAGASSSSSHQQHQAKPDATSQQLKYRWHGCPELHKAMDGVTYIADHTKKEEESTKVRHFFSKHNYVNREQTICHSTRTEHKNKTSLWNDDEGYREMFLLVSYSCHFIQIVYSFP